MKKTKKMKDLGSCPKPCPNRFKGSELGHWGLMTFAGLTKFPFGVIFTEPVGKSSVPSQSRYSPNGFAGVSSLTLAGFLRRNSNASSKNRPFFSPTDR